MLSIDDNVDPQTVRANQTIGIKLDMHGWGACHHQLMSGISLAPPQTARDVESYFHVPRN